MPDPKDNAKASGDVHPPELEEAARERPRGQPDTEGAFGSDKETPLARELDSEGRAGKGENQAGYLKDKDAPGMGNEGSKSAKR
jgi:hypothetical protein